MPLHFEPSHFFLLEDIPAERLLSGGHDWPLVVLSVLIAAGASYLALTLATLARHIHSSRTRRLHLATGALALGGGVWSMHFIGMLAFELCTPVDYDLGITLASGVPAVMAAGVTLGLLARPAVTGARVAVAGLAVGAGIGAMHYIGMAAMTLGPLLRYEPVRFAASLVVAVVLASLALWISFGLRSRLAIRGIRLRITAALVMGAAIAGMHYTAMAATRFVGVPDAGAAAVRNDHFTLALTIAVVTVGLSLLIVLINLLARYRSLLQLAESTAEERNAVQVQLAESEAQYRTLIGNLPGAAFRCLWDAHWTALFVSPRIRDITGWEAEDFLQGRKTIGELLHSGDEGETDAYLQRALERRESWDIRYRMRHRDGSWRWVSEVATPIFDAAGQVRWIDGILVDVTERQRMESDLRRAKEEAEAAAHAKSRFLANMSHEIRTPMNAILGFTDLLLETPLSEQQIRNLGVVRKSARSLLSLLNDILDTAKLESGATELEHRDFSLRDVCEQIVATLSLSAAQKSLSLVLDYEKDVGDYFVGDPLRIQQVLLNLASNAVKFTERGGVSLRVSRDPECKGVLFRVTDTGMGMSESVLENLFDPFVQADSSMTRRYGGTGLGTTIARQLVELMAGSIAVESAPGEGSEFRVCLPLLPGRRPAEEPVGGEEVCLAPLQVLVVDDVEQNVELIATVLGKRGHTVRAASNGEEAVASWRREPCDLVLMDVQMPVLNGHDACRQIREYERQEGRHRTPVLALTASVLLEDRRRAQAAGMDGFVAKPLDVQALLSEIARVTKGGASAPVDVDLPSVQSTLPLVDSARVAGMWGNPASHANAAARFLATLPAELATLTTEVVDQADAAAGRLHRLRGAAGNLLLSRLADALVVLEDRVTAGAGVADAMASARAALQATMARFPISADDRADPQSREEAPLDRELLERTLQRLDHGEIPSEELRRLITMLSASQAAALEEAMESFDTESAMQVLVVFRDQQSHWGHVHE